MYLRVNAGQLDPVTRNNLSNRFTYYDDVFNYRNPQAVAEQKAPVKRKRLELFVKMIDATHVLALAPEIGVGLLLDLK